MQMGQKFILENSSGMGQKKKKRGTDLIFIATEPDFRVVNIKKNKSVPFSGNFSTIWENTNRRMWPSA
jgi:hypothetical protein